MAISAMDMRRVATRGSRSGPERSLGARRVYLDPVELLRGAICDPRASRGLVDCWSTAELSRRPVKEKVSGARNLCARIHVYEHRREKEEGRALRVRMQKAGQQ